MEIILCYAVLSRTITKSLEIHLLIVAYNLFNTKNESVELTSKNKSSSGSVGPKRVGSHTAIEAIVALLDVTDSQDVVRD